MRLLATGLLLALLTVSCGGGRTEARLDHYGLEGPDALRVAVDGCRVDSTVESLEETATEVRVLVLRDQPSGWLGQSNCQDTVLLQLAEPLGARAVINARSGVAVPLLGG
jgi:hypothetical protein